MTNSEKQMAKELYHLQGYRQFSDWEVRFIENLYNKPWYDCLTPRQQKYLEKLWQEHIGFPQARPCVYPLPCAEPRRHFEIHHDAKPIFDPIHVLRAQVKGLELSINSLMRENRELNSAIDRLTNGQSHLFRDAEDMEEFCIDLNNRIVELEVEQ